MTEQELQQRRRARWRVDGARPVETIDAAAEFIAEMGLCLEFPVKPWVVAPTWMGACAGTEADLPLAAQAFRDPRLPRARELKTRLLRQRTAFEVRYQGETNLLLSAEMFPFFYPLAGDRIPAREAASLGEKDKTSQLARDTFAVVQRKGPISARRLQTELGGEVSESSLAHALHQMWARLRVTRVDEGEDEGATWDVLHRWAPEAVEQGAAMSVPQGLSALVSKYLDAVVAAEAAEIESFFAPMVARARVRETVNALLAARQFSLIPAGRHTLVQNTPVETLGAGKPMRPLAAQRRRSGGR